MKELYKPVFWCGFALSLSALYAGAEKLASSSEGSIQKPVLMQISIGESVQGEFESEPRVGMQETDKELQYPDHPFPGSQNGLTPALPGKNSAFFEVARAATESP